MTKKRAATEKAGEARQREHRRDVFAAVALNGWLAANVLAVPVCPDELAKRAYEWADAMMEARKK